MKVLIVDDRAESRLLLHDLLAERGYGILQAGDGESALSLTRREHPDMVISDILMPHMDGFDLCREIKADPALRHTAFVFYSATFVEPEDERLAMDLGASCFMRKPIESEQFLAAIDAVVARRRDGMLPIPGAISSPTDELGQRHDKRLTDKLFETTHALGIAQLSLSTLIGNLPGMVYRCRNDPDWRMEFVSEGCLSLTGYTPAALVGNGRISFGQLIHKDDRERVWQAVQAGIAAREPYQVEYRLIDRRGGMHRVWEQGRCIDHGAVPALLEGYIADVTAQRRVEAERNRYFDLSLDMLCIAGEDGFFKQVNPSWTRVLGWSESELLSRPWLEFVHPDDRAAAGQARKIFVDGRQSISFENRYLHKSGGHRWLSWNSSSLPEEGLVFGAAHDITGRIEVQRQLNRLNRTLRTLSAGNRALVHVTDEAQLLHEMCRIAVEDGGYSMAWVGYAEHDASQTIRPVAQAGVASDYLDRLNLNWADTEHGQGPGGRAIRLGVTQVVQDIQGDPNMAPWHEAARTHGFASVIALPLAVKHRTFGMLAIYGGEVGSFLPQEISLLEELAGDLSVGIASHRVHAEKLQVESHFQESLIQTIQAIAMTVEKRDPYTAGHQNRVAALAAAIATELALPEDQIYGIRLGAMIHDIGKISIPAEILNRPGRLTVPEFGIVMSHPDVGYDIVKDIRFPWPIAQMIHQHHERLDGSGYPQGLRGDEILLEARILAVADVVEAITSHRPYRPALAMDKALGEIISRKGSGFEPRVVEACARLIEGGGFSF
jgi:PAS domain S-box-containing protein